MKAVGIDLGTTGISGILIDANSGEVIKSITKNSNAFIQTKNKWEKIQDVDKIINLAKSILDDLLSDDVCAIGVTGQMHGIVYFDECGKAVSPLYIWQDERGNLPFKNTTYAKELNSYSGYGCVTDFYNRVNGLIDKNAVGFCTIADYFVMQLSNIKTPIIHTTNAASFGCFDLQTKKFSYDCNNEINDCFTIAGYYKNIPVSVAIGDNQASVLSTCKENDLLLNVGTGSQVSVISSEVCVADNVETRPYFEGKRLIVGSALCGGRAYSLVKDFIRDILRLKVDVTDDDVYALMSNMIKNVKNPTVKADTRFAGTRANRYLSGSFYNVNTENFTAGEFVCAVLDGMVEELYGMYKLFKTERTTVVGAGNGIRKNKKLVDVIERTFNCVVKIPAHTEEASFGAALFALVATKKYSSILEAQKLIRYI